MGCCRSQALYLRRPTFLKPRITAESSPGSFRKSFFVFGLQLANALDARPSQLPAFHAPALTTFLPGGIPGEDWDAEFNRMRKVMSASGIMPEKQRQLGVSCRRSEGVFNCPPFPAPCRWSFRACCQTRYRRVTVDVFPGSCRQRKLEQGSVARVFLGAAWR